MKSANSISSRDISKSFTEILKIPQMYRAFFFLLLFPWDFVHLFLLVLFSLFSTNLNIILIVYNSFAKAKLVPPPYFVCAVSIHLLSTG